MGLKTALVKLGAAKTIAQILSWSATILVMRIASPAEYGTVALSSFILGIVGAIAEFGIVRSLVREPTYGPELEAETRLLSLLFAGVATLLALALGAIASPLYENPDIQRALALQVASYGFSATSTVSEARFLRKQLYSRIASIEFFASLSMPLTALLLSLNGYTLYALCMPIVIFQAVRSLLYTYYDHDEHKFARLRPVKDNSILANGLYTTPISILHLFESSIDIAVAGKFLSKYDLGIYSTASYWAHMPFGRIMSVLNSIAYPELSKAALQGKQKASYLYVTANSAILLSIIIFPTLAGISGFIVDVLLGEKWAPIKQPFMIFLLTMPFKFLTESITLPVQAFGHSKSLIKGQVCSLFLVACFCLIGSKFGIAGVSFGYFLGVLLGSSLKINWALKQFNTNIFDLLTPSIPHCFYFLAIITLNYLISSSFRLDALPYNAANAAVFLSLNLLAIILIYVFHFEHLKRLLLSKLR